MYVRQVGPRAVHHRRRFHKTPVHKRAGDPPTFALHTVDAARHKRDARRLRSTHKRVGVAARVDPARSARVHDADDVLRQSRERLARGGAVEHVKARGQRVESVEDAGRRRLVRGERRVVSHVA